DDRALVNGVFEDYTRWLDGWRASHPLPSWARPGGPGLLDGDFAITIEREGLSLGVVGLNSSFLHLTGRVVRGQIALHPHQLHSVRGGPGGRGGWAGGRGDRHGFYAIFRGGVERSCEGLPGARRPPDRRLRQGPLGKR